MRKDSTEARGEQVRIDGIGITEDVLTGRGGLAVFVRYLRGIDIFPHLERLFGTIRRSRKGQAVGEVFKQLICCFVEGTSRHVTRFDELKRDGGYAAAIETPVERMVSSHGVKRFMRAFWWKRIWLFRRLLIKLLVWRLKVRQPEVVVLGLDSVVFDNDDAEERHGVEPTYKKVKGFHPLLLTWGGYVVDAVFRGGSKHSNHGETAEEMVRHVVEQIRRHYREDVPIVIRADSAFLDQELFGGWEREGIGYVVGGKLYEDIKRYVEGMPRASFGRYANREQAWDWLEYGDKRDAWDRFRRAFYLRSVYEDGQVLMEFARPERVVYTNLGMGGKIDEMLVAAGHEELVRGEKVIETYHGRGRDELVFRGLKEFGHEELPFKRFNMNAAYFYTMVLSYFLLEAYKEDVGAVVVSVTAYATTVRRKLIDIAAKIVRHGGRIILKVTRATAEELRLHDLWRLSGTPPRFAWP